MEGTTSNVNKSSAPAKDSSLSEGKTAGPDHGATKSASSIANASPAIGSSSRTGPTDHESLGANPFKANKTPQPENGCLVWAPRTWRSDLNPMIRCVVDGHSGRSRVKYLTWDQSKSADFGIIDPRNPRGDFFNSDDYTLNEPLDLRGGNWNHATICFTANDKDDEDGGYGEDDYEPDVVASVFQYRRMKLPTLSQNAIWTEKPSFEWVDLRFRVVFLRGTFGVGTDPRRGRLRVVTHPGFGDSKSEMVMKIWPTPACSAIGLENEMMVYRACDGKGITPEFVGYVTEEGRHISMLTAYHRKAHKPENDDEKELCRTALHTFQLLTGRQRRPRANHKDNFLIEDGKALLIDLADVCSAEEVARNGGDWTQKLLDEQFDSYWDYDEHIVM